jgi:hypothetical protein
MLYALYNNPTAYAAAFNDVTVGRSSFFLGAHVGYDGVTGLGSPKAAGVVSALVGPVTTAAKTTTTTTTTTTTAQLARKATPAEQTVASSTTDVEVAPAPIKVNFTVNRVAQSLLSDSALTKTAAAAVLRPTDQSISATVAAGGADTSDRGSVFNAGRRVAAVFGAGYESGRSTSVFNLPSVPAMSEAAAVNPIAEAKGPWVLSGIVPIEPATTPGVMSALGGSILATQPATAAIMPQVATATNWFTRPRAIAVAVAAAAAEVVVLSYRRLRRRQSATAAAQVMGDPIVTPLDPDER